MPPEQPTPGTPEHWLARARGHLALAEQPKPEAVYWEDLAFHAQQSAELAIKAIYQRLGKAFEFTHDLEALLANLLAFGISVPGKIESAESLTKFATKTRYPGLVPPISESEFRIALKIASEVVRWAESEVGAHPPS